MFKRSLLVLSFALLHSISLSSHYSVYAQNLTQDQPFQNALLSAIEQEDLPALKLLLQSGQTVHLTESRHMPVMGSVGDYVSPLSLAIEKGRLDMVKLLFEAGAQIEPSTSFFNRGSLDLAVEAGQIELVQYLLEEHYTRPEFMNSALLHYAVYFNHPEILRYGLSLGISPNKPRTLSIHDAQSSKSFTSTPLHLAIQLGHKDMISDLLKGGADPNLSVNAYTPLLFALQKRDYALADKLLERGARRDLPVFYSRDLFAYFFSLNSNAQERQRFFRFLLDRQIDFHINHQYIGQLSSPTPLLLAAMQLKDFQTLELLLAAGADVNSTSILGVPPLVALYKQLSTDDFSEYVPMIQALQQAGARLDTKNVHGHNIVILELAARGQVQPLQVVLEQGASLRGHTGSAALALAAKEGHLPMLQFLLQSGVDPNRPTLIESTSAHGVILTTPWIEAVKSDRYEVVSQLLTHSRPKMDFKNMWGEDLFSLSSKKPRMRRLLLGQEQAKFDTSSELMDELFRAILENRPAGVEEALKKGADVQYPHQAFDMWFARPALDIALESEPEVMLSLLKYRAQQFSQSEQKKWLETAVSQESEPLVKALISAFDYSKTSHLHALQIALLQENGKILALLLPALSSEALSYVDWKLPVPVANLRRLEAFKHRLSPLQQRQQLLRAINNGNVDKVRYLLERGLELKSVSPDFLPALESIQAEQQQVLLLLVERGADLQSELEVKRQEMLPEYRSAYNGFDSLNLSTGLTAVAAYDAPEFDLTRAVFKLLAQEQGRNSAYLELIKKLLTQINDPILSDPVKEQKRTLPVLRSFIQGRHDLGVSLSPAEWSSLAIYAAQMGHLPALKLFLAQGASVKAQNAKGESALLHAAGLDNPEIYHYLISRGAPYKVRDHGGNTPLLFAAASGHPEIVRDLLKRGANPTEHNHKGDNALTFHLRRSQAPLAQFLIEQGVPVNAVGAEQKTPLLLALENHSAELVQELIAKGARVDVRDEQGNGVYHHVLNSYGKQSDQKLAIIEQLLKAGAPVLEPNHEGLTAFNPFFLTYAAFEASDVEELTYLLQRYHVSLSNLRLVDDDFRYFAGNEVLRYLAATGLDLQQRDSAGKTLFFYVDNAEDIDYLVRQGLDINALDAAGNTALFQPRSPEVLKAFLERGLRLKHQNRMGQTALFSQWNPSSLDFLHQQGLDLKHRDKRGRTLLFQDELTQARLIYLQRAGLKLKQQDDQGQTMLFTNQNYYPYLLEQGLRVNHRDHSGQTALMQLVHTMEYDETRIPPMNNVLTLLKLGADPNIRDQMGETALHKAVRQGKLKAVQTLLAHGADTEIKNNSGQRAQDLSQDPAILKLF